MPTKWLQVWVNGSKYGSGIPPRRAFCGEGGGHLVVVFTERCGCQRVPEQVHLRFSVWELASAIGWSRMETGNLNRLWGGEVSSSTRLMVRLWALS